jgi:hypothetical protein
MIKIDFEYETAQGKFRDALHLPKNHEYTDQEIENMKQQRLNNWLSIVTPTGEEVTIEESGILETIEIAGETYYRLQGVPPSGAELIEVSGVWYYKE